MTAWRWMTFGPPPGVLHLDSTWRPGMARSTRHAPACGRLGGETDDLGTEDMGSVKRCVQCQLIMLRQMEKTTAH